MNTKAGEKCLLRFCLHIFFRTAVIRGRGLQELDTSHVRLTPQTTTPQSSLPTTRAIKSRQTRFSSSNSPHPENARITRPATDQHYARDDVDSQPARTKHVSYGGVTKSYYSMRSTQPMWMEN